MKSIRAKFVLLNAVSILLCVVLTGVTSYYMVSRLQEDSANKILSLTCSEQARVLNEQLSDIQRSVDLFAAVASDYLPSLDTFEDPDRLSLFLFETESLMSNIADNTVGVCTYYMRVAPEFSDESIGFWYERKNESEPFHRNVLTVIEKYDPEDTEHVGWLYQPMLAGSAIWMEPYYNLNADIYMISYVAPLYIDGVFWGIAGMDVDFDAVTDLVSSIKPFETSYALLIARNGSVYYHPSGETSGNLADYAPELETVIADFSRKGVPDSAIYQYHYGDIAKEVAFCPLANGMTLALTVRSGEITAPQDTLLRMLVLFALLVVLIMTLVVMLVARRIVRPLQQLTLAADEIAAGNMDVTLPPPGSDEVGRLARSFGITVDSLRRYIKGMTDIAYRDPLTHVKNRAAYERAADEMRPAMEAGTAEFALLMMDLNNLKVINDKHGHNRGNDYLMNCCMAICKTFKHSPVFRVGGDEFLVILQGDDLHDSPSLLDALDQRMSESSIAANPWDRISIAKGLAHYTPGDQSMDDVFRRADNAMYDDKRRMKAARTDAAVRTGDALIAHPAPAP